MRLLPVTFSTVQKKKEPKRLFFIYIPLDRMEYKVYNIIVRTLKTNFAVLSERPKGGGLENRWAERPRGFESYIRRHFCGFTQVGLRGRFAKPLV